MKSEQATDGRQRRRDRLIQEAVHDPYKAAAKPGEPTVCRECGIVYDEGRWHWPPEPPAGAAKALCPACRRIDEGVPAGFLTLSGAFFRKHRREIVNLVENVIERQQSEHPLKRLMGIDDIEEGIVITFTDIHLPRSIGEAIERAYDGTLDIQFGEESGISRVYWQRED